MKLSTVLFALFTACSAPALAGPGDHAHQPRHGGVLSEGRQFDFELVARSGRVELYLTDHGKPLDLAGATAQVTLLSAAGKQAVLLHPKGDRLQAEGSFEPGPGTRAVAVVSRHGKVLGTANFQLK